MDSLTRTCFLSIAPYSSTLLHLMTVTMILLQRIFQSAQDDVDGAKSLNDFDSFDDFDNNTHLSSFMSTKKSLKRRNKKPSAENGNVEELSKCLTLYLKEKKDKIEDTEDTFGKTLKNEPRFKPNLA